MEYIVRKFFIDYEQEEKWLNEMSDKGYALSKYSFLKYTFTECAPEQYTYRLKILRSLPDHPESISYLKRASENGIEAIAAYKRKIYLRKQGNFTLSVDNDAKKKHYEKIFLLFYMLMLAQLALGCGNLIVSMHDLPVRFFGIIIGAMMLAVGFVIGLTIVFPLYKRIKLLKNE